MNRRTRIAAAAAVTVALATMSACQYDGPQSLPLPGGVGGDGYRITVVLQDATNLVPKETCRTNDTVVGSVESVELDDELHARVVCRIDPDVKIPANAVGTLRETSLLGERYVALDPPPGRTPAGELAADSTIPAARTRVHPDTELVLGALSQILNGGSLGSIETISTELSAALDGRATGVRRTARRVAVLLRTLDRRSDALIGALDAVDHLSRTLAGQRRVIAQALEEMPAGLAALHRQRPDLVRMLRNLARLSTTAVPLIRQSKAATLADLEHLRPVLGQLVEAKTEVVRTIERLTSFPFSRNALTTIKGDYAGMFGQALINVDTLNELLRSLATQSATAGNPDTTADGPDEPTIDELLDQFSLDDLVGATEDLVGSGALTDLPELLGLGGGRGTHRQAGTSGRTEVSAPADDQPPADLADLLIGGVS